MKKMLALIMLVSLCSLDLQAKDRYTENIAELPAAAQKFIRQNFPKQKVHHIKIDKPVIGAADYDVVLDNGTEIEFDSSGNWKEVDCGMNAVPAAVMLKTISAYVKSNYPKDRIVKIEEDAREYEVKLSNGVDLKFYRDGRFKKID